jgi:hypothetical protein
MLVNIPNINRLALILCLFFWKNAYFIFQLKEKNSLAFFQKNKLSLVAIEQLIKVRSVLAVAAGFLGWRVGCADILHNEFIGHFSCTIMTYYVT